MSGVVSFVLDGKLVSHDCSGDASLRPTTTVLNYLRSLPNHKGVKEGCAEGDCGACTVVIGELGPEKKIRYESIDSCLVFLPMLHGKQLITVENLKNSEELHPIQAAMVETGGSQCGYCTPGIIMALFSLYKNSDHPSREEIDDALTGNLCRCTGYKTIIEAAALACVHEGIDQFTTEEPHVARLLDSIPQQSLTIKTDHQQYFQPRTLQEVLTLKHELPNAFVISGATDVALRVTKKHEWLREVVDLSAIDELKMMDDTDGAFIIGAGTSLNDVMAAVRKDFPALSDMIAVFGSQQIRNLATLGGNLGTASPIGDSLPVLMAYNASVVLQSVEGKREVLLDEFFTGYRRTLRKPNELIIGVTIPKLLNGTHVKSYKISKRKDLDISTVSAGFRLELSGGRTIEFVKLAYGGMAERIKRATAAETFLLGKTWERVVVEQAMPLIDQDFTPISDARAGAEMRRIAAKNLLLKFWSETVDEKR